MTPRVTIVIPNWNGREFLPRCIAGTLQSARVASVETEILLLDDASSDGSADTIARDFPSVRLLRNPVNVGFGETVNRGAREAAGEILVFLNNDLVPKEAMIAELVAPLLADPGLFGVSGRTVDWGSESANHVNMAGHFENGDFRLTFEDSPNPSPTMFVQGGSCAVRRDLFLRFGGFHRIFAPGYWEDYDLSYLALKAGYRNLYTPRASAYHLGQGSMVRAYGRHRVEILKMRNRQIFLWLNLTDGEILRRHCGAIPGLVGRAFLRPGESRTWLRGFAAALPLLDAVQTERSRRASWIRRTDHEVLEEFAAHGEAARP